MEKYIGFAIAFGAAVFIFSQVMLFTADMSSQAGDALGSSLLSGDYLNAGTAAKFVKP